MKVLNLPKGIIGPIPIGSIQPHQIIDLLRTLSIGEVCPPTILGDWHVILRLEQLTPSRFNSDMKKFLLAKKLDHLLDQRVESLLRGETLPPLSFHSNS